MFTNQIKLGDKVLYPKIDKCPFVVTGIKHDQLEITGDFSGGTAGFNQTDWVSIDELLPYQPNRDYKWKEYIRKDAESTIALLQGYAHEQRRRNGNALSTIEIMAGYVLQLTNPATIISAFPGVGKTYLYNSRSHVLDSDSSKFDKSDFPRNYIEHIKSNIFDADLILVSSHEVVRKELEKQKMYFTLVYPAPSLKEEYLQRYRDRGSSQAFIDLIDKNWDDWLYEITSQRGCRHVELKSGEYLIDVLK